MDSHTSIVLVLHNIRSLHNVGSIFRTADAAGIEKIYLCGITPAPLDRFGNIRPEIAKVALGAEKTVLWEKVFRVARMIDILKKDDYRIFAVEQSQKAIPYDAVKIKKRGLKIALILGNEVKGLPSSILNRADTILEIPMSGVMVRSAHHPRHVTCLRAPIDHRRDVRGARAHQGPDPRQRRRFPRRHD